MANITDQKPTLEPDDFKIVRKRKKYRFALFFNATNCFELEEWKILRHKQLVVEVGAGTGLFLVGLAQKYPAKMFIALDVKGDRLQKGGREALRLGLTNIFFVRARADQLLNVVEPASVSEIWLTFSDPFPRKVDSKRRLTAPGYLEIYKNALVSEKAQLHMKTDSSLLFDWSLEQMVANGWQITALTRDLHQSKIPDDYKIMTTYEKKWTTAGLQIYFLSATVDGGS